MLIIIASKSTFVNNLIEQRLVSKKLLKNISEDFPLADDNAANCLWRHYKERLNEQNTRYKPSIKLNSTIPKIMKSDRTANHHWITSKLSEIALTGRASTLTSTEIHKKKYWKSEASSYHHCIKKHICHYFNWTKTNLKKMLKKISEDFLVVGENAANCTSKYYTEKLNKQKVFTTFYQTQLEYSKTLWNQIPPLTIMASQLNCQNSYQLRRTSTLTCTEIHKENQKLEPSAFHHCIKKHIIQHFKWTKINIEKNLTKNLKTLSVFGDNAAICTLKSIIKWLNKQKNSLKAFYQPKLKILTEKLKIRDQCLSIIASKNTFVINLIEQRLTSRKNLQQFQNPFQWLVTMQPIIHLPAL